MHLISQTPREIPLVVVACADGTQSSPVVERLREEGAVVYPTHGLQGCLRVATSVHPDVVLLDPRLPRKTEMLLRAHPSGARASISWLPVLQELPAPTSLPRRSAVTLSAA